MSGCGCQQAGRVWFAHARRDYGTARAEAGRAAIASLFPGAAVVDPERLRWEPGIAERLVPRCKALAWLPREPDALGVLREIEIARRAGVPVVDLSPYIVPKLPKPLTKLLERAIPTICPPEPPEPPWPHWCDTIQMYRDFHPGGYLLPDGSEALDTWRFTWDWDNSLLDPTGEGGQGTLHVRVWQWVPWVLSSPGPRLVWVEGHFSDSMPVRWIEGYWEWHLEDPVLFPPHWSIVYDEEVPVGEVHHEWWQTEGRDITHRQECWCSVDGTCYHRNDGGPWPE